MNQLTIAESIALGNFLTVFPNNLSFHAIIDLVNDEHESVIFWQPFESWEGHQLVNQIVLLEETIQTAIEAAIEESKK